MKKGLLGVVALATLLLVGCSSDEEMANIETAARNAIDFNVAASSMETKATPIFKSSDLENTDLDVFAYYSDSGALYMGNQAGNDGIDIVYKNSKCDYKNSLDMAYWPSGKLNFYAICPAIAEVNRNNCNWLIKNDTNTVFCRLVDEYNPQREAKTFNYDLMYATAFNYDKNTNDSKVKLTFKHALTQVIFKALTTKSTMVCYIRSLRIKNLKNCGTFRIPTELTEDGHYARNPKSSDWTLADSYDSFSDCIEKEIQIHHKGSDPVRLSNIYKPLFVLPQKSNAWSTTPAQPVSIAKADENHETYLEISMKLKLIDDGKYLFGSDSVYETVYLPFNTIHIDSNHDKEGWQPGYRYVYRIYFGGGYDADGKLIQKSPKVEATVEEWQSLISFACGN